MEEDCEDPECQGWWELRKGERGHGSGVVVQGLSLAGSLIDLIF